MLTLIVFILILSLLILVHELGHFMTAKKFGVKVEEFGLGLPPRVFGKKIGETIYSLNLLPFGGFVKLEGEDVENSSPEALQFKPTSFAAKPPLQRAIILVFGVFMNLLLAFVLYYILLGSNGFKSLDIPLIFDYRFRFGSTETLGTVVTGFQDGSPAQTGGIEQGEAIIEINNQPVYSVQDIRKELAGKIGTPVNVLLVDLRKGGDSIRSVSVIPTADEDGNPILGVYLSKAVKIVYAKPLEKLLAGPLHSYNMLAYSGYTFSRLVSLSVQEKTVAPVSEGIAGPVGIYAVVGGILTYGGERALLSLVDFVALMSLSLAFINIIPLPALDGGRLLFVGLEIVRGKRLNPAVEGFVHKIGIILFLALIALITVKDILRLF